MKLAVTNRPCFYHCYDNNHCGGHTGTSALRIPHISSQQAAYMNLKKNHNCIIPLGLYLYEHHETTLYHADVLCYWSSCMGLENQIDSHWMIKYTLLEYG